MDAQVLHEDEVEIGHDDGAEPEVVAEPVAVAPAPVERETSWNGVTSPSQRTAGGTRFLTDVIVDLGLTERERVDAAVETARTTGTTPERLLLAEGHLTQDGLARALAERHGLDHLDLGAFQVDMQAANLISTSAAKRYEAVPVGHLDERTVLVAMADPANVLAVDDIAIMTGLDVHPAVASREDIGTLISRLSRLDDVVPEYHHDDQSAASPAEVVDLKQSSDDAPTVKLVNQIMVQAIEQGASDIH